MIIYSLESTMGVLVLFLINFVSFCFESLVKFSGSCLLGWDFLKIEGIDAVGQFPFSFGILIVIEARRIVAWSFNLIFWDFFEFFEIGADFL